MEETAGIRVLTVEDDESTALLVSMILRNKLGATVDIAPDCASARERLVSNSYDLVTLDYQLPDGDGLALAEEIMSDEGAPPVVMATGHGDEQTAVRAFRAGVSGYVVKDARMSTLLLEEARSALARAELRKTSGRLAFERQQLLSIFDGLDEPVYVSDPETYEVLYANRAIDKLVGEAVGKKCHVVLQGRSEPCPFCTNPIIFGEGEGNTHIWEFYNEHIRGWYRCIDRAIRWPDGRRVRLELSIDITERRAVEEALLASEERYQAVVEGQTELICRFAPGGVLAFVNEAYCKYFDRTRDELLGRSFFELLPGNAVKTTEKNLSSLTPGQPTLLNEHRVIVPDGEIRWQQWTNTAFFDSEGNLLEYQSVGRDITGQKRMEEALRESEAKSRRMLELTLSPEVDIETLELTDIINVHAIQSIMEDFHKLTGIGVAIADLYGKILVATGWQDICTRFHRVHPTTRANCVESDTHLASGVQPGDYKIYKCKNMMWDIATPIIAGEKQIGNLFLGQFLFEGESPDYDTFRRQARECGFDEREYLDALERVPRYSRETIDTVMTFYARFAHMISTMGHDRIKLARTLSEREELLDSLRASEALLNSTQQLSRMGGWEWDIDKQIMFWTEETYRIHGFDPEDFQPANPEHLVRSLACYDPKDRITILDNFQKCLEEGKPFDMELPFTTADGRRISTRIAARAEWNRGRVVRVIGNTADVTSWKETEAKLMKANAELDGYAHTVSHDLKGPLANIVTSAGILEEAARGEGTSLPEGAAAEALRIVVNNAERAVKLTENLLELASAGRERGDVGQVDVSAVVGSILEEQDGSICTGGVEVQVDEDLGSVAVNETHVYQVFSNLVRNALKYGGGRGTLVEVRMLQPVEPETNRYLVRDSGPGIPPEDLDDIFIPFRRSARDRDTMDTGVGLSIVDRIVRLYGGAVGAYNDGGACFELTLPSTGRMTARR